MRVKGAPQKQAGFLMEHLSRTWSFEKPEFEPLREPCSLRLFSRDILSDDGGFTVKHHQQTFV